jgi:hypothetical protein
MHITFFKYDVAGYPIEKFETCVIKWKTGYLKQKNISIKKCYQNPFIGAKRKRFYYEFKFIFQKYWKFHINKTAIILNPDSNPKSEPSLDYNSK